MKLTAALLALIVAQPVSAATLNESKLTAIVTGEAMCALARYNAPKDVMRAEFARIVDKYRAADLVDLSAHGEEFVGIIERIMEACPKRGLSDA